MPDNPEHRHGPDRRRQPRGGRRAEDRDGFAPLILVVGQDRSVEEQSEAILARLKFAVSRTPSVDDALRVMPDLRPDLVIAREPDDARIRAATRAPVVVMRSGPAPDVEVLIDDVLRTLRRAASSN
jgi:hypothetical protein